MRAARVLVTEDNDDHAALIVRTLRRPPLDAEITRVANGREAVNVLESSEKPDLVFLDLKMPVVDGLELLRIVREEMKLCRLPVVVLTTSAAERDRHRAFENGANSYLVKGTDPAEFREMLEDAKKYWLRWDRARS